MSEQPTEPPDEVPKRRLSKYVERVKTILRKGDPSKRFSRSFIAAPTGDQSAAPATETAETTPAVTATTTAPDTTATATTPVTPPEVVIAMRSATDLERIRRLIEKYGLDLNTENWTAKEVGDRVEKPIRVRIHRTCHQCQATFGPLKNCPSCGHRRCGECPRYPKKKDPADKGKGVRSGRRRDIIAGGYEGDAGEGLKRKHKLILTIPSRTGGQDLVLRKPKQRIRRTCHQCGTLYLMGKKICPKCEHVRCVDCPRDPPKRNKFPDGYPGDAQGSEEDIGSGDAQPTSRAIPRHKARHSCHSCGTIFQHQQPTCANCGHEKCPECKWVPPKKVEPEPDPEVVKKVEERLRGLKIRAGSTTTDPPPL